MSLTNVTEMILSQLDLRQIQNDTSSGSRISKMGLWGKNPLLGKGFAENHIKIKETGTRVGTCYQRPPRIRLSPNNKQYEFFPANQRHSTIIITY